MTRARSEIVLDLPFLVNGTLGAAEKAEIEALMAEDALLAAEHEALAAIREGMQAEDIRSPGEFGLARLMRDVGREGAGPATLKDPVQAPTRAWVWQVAAALAVIGFLAQGYLLRESSSPQGGYQLAGAAQPGALVVTFAPGATEESIRALLVEQNLEIVAGPTALGLYRLDLVGGGDPAAASAALAAAADIVESVENAPN